MILAELFPGDFGYDLLLLLHLVCVVVGFGSTFVYPFLGAQAQKRRGVEAAALSDSSLIAAKRVTTPVIYAAGAFGLILVLVGPAEFSDSWVGIAMALFIAAVLFSALVHVPNLLAMNKLTIELAAMGPPPAGAAASGPPPQVAEMEARGKRAAMNGGILHLAFLLLMIDMIFKPGA